MADLEMDPLTEHDALQEAQIVDVRLDALRGTGALLFDMRMALQIRGISAAILSFGGVRHLHWEAPERDTLLTAWNVVGTSVSTINGLFTIDIDHWPSALLSTTARHAAFIYATIPGLSETPPDYSDDPSPEKLVTWESQFQPTGMTRTN